METRLLKINGTSNRIILHANEVYMSELIVEAQELIVIDPASLHNISEHMSMEPLEVSEELPPMSMEPMEVHEPVEIEIVVEELPGAPAGTKDPEPILEVSEDDTNTADTIRLGSRERAHI